MRAGVRDLHGCVLLGQLRTIATKAHQRIKERREESHSAECQLGGKRSQMVVIIIVVVSKSFSVTFSVSFVCLFSGEGREQAVVGTVCCHPSKLVVDERIL